MQICKELQIWFIQQGSRSHAILLLLHVAIVLKEFRLKIVFVTLNLNLWIKRVEKIVFFLKYGKILFWSLNFIKFLF